ncbi:MAG: UDP-N-acetylmuramate dehydrogenase [Deltaproteobacteria bacterium]|nr:UDP-N-acetylmuramate dehydrogenase [Deltaproteobacteria bacterium]
MTALEPEDRDWLAQALPQDVVFDEPMARHTTLRVGGPAEALVRPASREDLVRLIRWADARGIACLPLGAGSNILVRDRGISGIVVLLDRCLREIVTGNAGAERPLVKAGAGLKLSALCAYGLKHGLQGFNFALGIPGTVGGSLWVNAGTGDACMGDLLESVTVLLPAGRVRTMGKAMLHFSYRKMAWPAELKIERGRQPIILEAAFRLRKGKRDSLRKEAGRLLKHRNRRQPWTLPSAGCIFKNPPGERSAGELIDLAGLKGKRIGDAEISTKHANFIVNRGRAAAADILALVDLATDAVYEHHRVKLETEVKIVG